VAAVTVQIDIARKAYPARDDAPERRIFENLRLSLAPSEVCAVTGPSGIGKSSLLQLIAGLDEDYDGTIVGRPERLGYLFQNPRLLPWRTARENLELVLPGRSGEALHWLRRVGLEEAANVHPSRLSVGMARRISLARALAVEPQLLLLDEPFSALDAETARLMQRLIRHEVSRLGTTVLLVTHSWQEAAALAGRIVVLEGSPARIVSDAPIPQAKAAE
jgi:ABC-type nitrate/sulfonate/bicarbonate transport system ATPase subunit